MCVCVEYDVCMENVAHVLCGCVLFVFDPHTDCLFVGWETREMLEVRMQFSNMCFSSVCVCVRICFKCAVNVHCFFVVYSLSTYICIFVFKYTMGGGKMDKSSSIVVGVCLCPSSQVWWYVG